MYPIIQRLTVTEILEWGEDELEVDLDAGSDDRDCGSKAKPCRDLRHVLMIDVRGGHKNVLQFTLETAHQ